MNIWRIFDLHIFDHSLRICKIFSLVSVEKAWQVPRSEAHAEVSSIGVRDILISVIESFVAESDRIIE